MTSFKETLSVVFHKIKGGMKRDEILKKVFLGVFLAALIYALKKFGMIPCPTSISFLSMFRSVSSPKSSDSNGATEAPEAHPVCPDPLQLSLESKNEEGGIARLKAVIKNSGSGLERVNSPGYFLLVVPGELKILDRRMKTGRFDFPDLLKRNPDGSNSSVVQKLIEGRITDAVNEVQSYNAQTPGFSLARLERLSPPECAGIDPDKSVSEVETLKCEPGQYQATLFTLGADGAVTEVSHYFTVKK